MKTKTLRCNNQRCYRAILRYILAELDIYYKAFSTTLYVTLDTFREVDTQMVVSSLFFTFGNDLLPIAHIFETKFNVLTEFWSFTWNDIFSTRLLPIHVSVVAYHLSFRSSNAEDDITLFQRNSTIPFSPVDKTSLNAVYLYKNCMHLTLRLYYCFKIAQISLLFISLTR